MFSRIKKWFSRPSNPAGNVYYARLNTPQGIFYKLGFTTKPTLVERMAFGNQGDEKLIDHQFVFTYRDDGYHVEQALLKHFNKRRAFGKYSNDPTKPLNGRGQSELFASDILGLDDDLYKWPDEATMKLIKEDAQEYCFGFGIIVLSIVLTFITSGIWLIVLAVLGIMSLFGTKPSVAMAFKTRPVHPPAVQALIDALVSGSNCGPAANTSPDALKLHEPADPPDVEADATVQASAA